MSHVRKQIRERAVSKLLIGLSSIVGTRVYESRVLPLAEFPSVCVYTMQEKPGDDDTLDSAIRTLDLVADVYVSGASPDDQMDAIASVIESTLYGDKSGGRVLNSLAMAIKSPPTTAVDMRGDGETTYGIMRIVFKVLYLTQDGDPEHAG